MLTKPALTALFSRLHGAPFAIVWWDGSQRQFGQGNPLFILHFAQEPDFGSEDPILALGEAYMHGGLDIRGDWNALLDVLYRNRQLLDGPLARMASVVRTLDRMRLKQKQKANIAHHYDLGNDFYRLWLDDSMSYSCAYFARPDMTLAEAQQAKIDHTLVKLALAPDERLLDIGCGWGALILRAAQHWGARCVGITLSQQQYDLARARIAAAGLEDRCEVRLQDYRDVTGRFDRITSVGMFEHVGLKNLRAYFARIHELLEDDGVVLNHGITSTDPDSGEVPWGGGSFIERYVFPHGELPHIGLTLREMAAAGLEATDVENLRRHYARTLEHWSYRFETAGDTLRAMVGDRRYRIWRIYLAGCAYGFSHGWVALHQIVATKANSLGSETMPWTRDYIYNDQGAGI